MPWGVAWLTKKSRAWGSVSESQVSTLIPRCRAFSSTEAIPLRFSTATARTSTPRVIQVSTISFCLADLDTEARHLEGVGRRQEVVADNGEEEDLGGQEQGQDHR